MKTICVICHSGQERLRPEARDKSQNPTVLPFVQVIQRHPVVQRSKAQEFKRLMSPVEETIAHYGMGDRLYF
jgi:hypothetical protein